MSLRLKDMPGMLVKVLDPISSKGGNIKSVYHRRGSGDYVKVDIKFDVTDDKTLQRIITSLKKQNIGVQKVLLEGRKYYHKISMSYLFLGHVIDRDIQDSIDKINELGHVSNLDVKMTDPLDESAVLIDVDVDLRLKDKLSECINKLCIEKNFLCIRQVNG